LNIHGLTRDRRNLLITMSAADEVKTLLSQIDLLKQENAELVCQLTSEQTKSIETLEIVQPDDFHLHLRDGPMLKVLVPHAAAQFGRAIIMPNLVPPVTTTADAEAYRGRILAEVPAGKSFVPLMTLYMTDKTSPEEIRKAKASGVVFAVKLYPKGATTNSDSGVTEISNVHETLSAMAEVGLPLCIHGEVTDKTIDTFDREALFYATLLPEIVSKYPSLRIIMEHITTKEAVDFVTNAGPNVAATITCHHLLYNRTAIFQGGLNPHMYCLPVLKRETHRQALLGAIKSGNPKFFLGSDSAPHIQSRKESGCGCAGVYTGHAALNLYAEAFEEINSLHLLEAFASKNGAAFYQLPENSAKVVLERQPWDVPAFYDLPDVGPVIPLRAGKQIEWKLAEA
jgi:dihydroorotase